MITIHHYIADNKVYITKIIIHHINVTKPLRLLDFFQEI